MHTFYPQYPVPKEKKDLSILIILLQYVLMYDIILHCQWQLIGDQRTYLKSNKWVDMKAVYLVYIWIENFSMIFIWKSSDI